MHRSRGVPSSPFVVGLGGSSRAGSATDIALITGLREAEKAGASTRFFGGEFLARLPLYTPDGVPPTSEQAELVEAVRACDGLILATPSYHGNVSSLVKNALDLLEALSDDARPYLHGRAVGCIVTGAGWQAGGITLAALRGTVHSLRGWPTPMGAALNTTSAPFSVTGACLDSAAADQIAVLARQVVAFALGRMLLEEATGPDLQARGTAALRSA